MLGYYHCTYLRFYLRRFRYNLYSKKISVVSDSDTIALQEYVYFRKNEDRESMVCFTP